MIVIVILICGTAAGWLATRLLRIEADIPTTIALGVFGCLIGYGALRLLSGLTGWAGAAVAALGGTFALIAALKYWRGR